MLHQFLAVTVTPKSASVYHIRDGMNEKRRRYLTVSKIAEWQSGGIKMHCRGSLRGGTKLAICKRLIKYPKGEHRIERVDKAQRGSKTPPHILSYHINLLKNFEPVSH